MNIEQLGEQELRAELERRQREKTREFVANVGDMPTPDLEDVVDDSDCAVLESSSWGPIKVDDPEHCRGCAAFAELDRREKEQRRIERSKPGALPLGYNGCASGHVSKLKVGDVLDYRPMPGVDYIEYVVVTAVNAYERSVTVMFQRTNDPDSRPFEVLYERNHVLSGIWVKR